LAVLFVVGVVVGSLDFVANPSTVQASAQLPDPALASQPMFNIVSQSSSSDNIDAPDDYAKLYINPTTVNPSVEIFDMTFDPCGNEYGGYDYIVPYAGACAYPPADPNDEVDYDFYNTNNQEQPQGAPMLSLDGANGTNAATGVSVIPEPARNTWSAAIQFGAAFTSPTSLQTGYRVIYVHVHFKNPLPGGLSIESHGYSFRTTNANDQLGYVDTPYGTPAYPAGVQPTNDQLVLHTIKPGVSDYEANFELDFAPSCLLTSDQQAALRWGDADDFYSTPSGGTDGNDFPGDQPPQFTFYQIPPTGPAPAPITIYHFADGAHSTPDIGGNNDYNELPFTAHPGWKYRWVWDNVNSAWNNGTAGANNILMWLPFDSINYNISCAYNYSSQIDVADGKTPGPLDISNPVNQHVKFYVDGTNSGAADGPIATTEPVCTENGAACTAADVSPDAATVGPSGNFIGGSGDLNRVIPAGQTLLGSNTGVQFGYNISPTIAPGTVLCFSDSITPVTPSNPGPAFSNQICYVIQNPTKRYPSVIGLNSDVQAGGGLCDVPLSATPGNITGNGSAASGDQYVLAASGSIGSFASNTGGADTLKLGAPPTAGGYAAVCRPDLLKAAIDGQGGPSQGTIGGTGTVSVDVGCLTTPAANCGSTTGGASAYYFNGGILQLSGVVHRKLTIVVTAGSVEITNPITIDPTATTTSLDPTAAPSLGVIADQDIAIDSGVTRVDAYLFADGVINTCALTTPPAANLTTPCGVPTPVLTVNGFLMGSNILFSRLGPAGSAGVQTAETIALNPQIYLNPPQFFDEASVDQSTLQGQGERQPLF
jgi:hypothetical protein